MSVNVSKHDNCSLNLSLNLTSLLPSIPHWFVPQLGNHAVTSKCLGPQNSQCAHLCYSFLDTYRCDCRNGYQLKPDGVSCGGESFNAPSPFEGLHEWECQAILCSQVGLSHENQETVWVNYRHLFVKLYRSELKALNTLALSVCTCMTMCLCVQTMMSAWTLTLCVYMYDHVSVCTDIDECFDNRGGCQHVCHNRNGSFFCSCRDNHQLRQDGKSCRGELITRGPCVPCPLHPILWTQIYQSHTSIFHIIQCKIEDGYVSVLVRPNFKNNILVVIFIQ